MRHKSTRLMIYNTLGFSKKILEKNFQIFNQISQKKNFWQISKNFELDMRYTVFRGVEHDAID